MSDDITGTSEVATENIFDIFGVDIEDVEQGKWFPFGSKMKFKIRRVTSKKSQKVRAKLEAPYKHRRAGTAGLPDAVMEDLNIKHIAEGLIADWQNVYGTDGKLIPYSIDNAIMLLSHEKIGLEFRLAITSISTEMDNYREEVAKDIEGN